MADYGANETPLFIRETLTTTPDYFGPERYHSDEFKEEAYPFCPV